MRISVIAPVLNEVQFIGYSVMALLPHVEEFVYTISPKSNDGTIELLRHIAKTYGHLGGKVRLLIDQRYDFDPLDTPAYNRAYDDAIAQSRGDAVFFCHPDMIVTKWQDPEPGPLAWWTKVTSFADDLTTVITRGRTDRWKNIHAKKMGLVYRGGYGSQNEDFYHSAITGTSYKHFGTEFAKYPYEISGSGIELNHYCEVKPYARRFEKMKLCLRTQYPEASDAEIEEAAKNHPRVSLNSSGRQFGQFEFSKDVGSVPFVFEKYGEEFNQFVHEKSDRILCHSSL